MTVTKDVTSDELLEISLMQKFCNDTVIDEENACCMCGTTKFIGRVNTGEKFYCNFCMRKINESGMDYWKPCTQVEFFESMLSHMRKGKKKRPRNIFNNIRETLGLFDEENKEK